MSTHKNRVKMTVASVAGAGLGTITLGSASSGRQSFATAYGGNATVDILIEEGTAWEVARDCTYTNSGTTVTRGTLEASSTGSAVSFTSAAVVSAIATADRGRTWDAASLNTQVAGTDANTTMAVNTLYTVDMSAWATADRTYTLPATAAVGDRIGVMVTAGNASFELLLTAGTGDTLNGVSGGTEWSRVFITNEAVIMRCIVANTTWVVEYDGRIPAYARVNNAGFSLTASTIMYPNWTVVSDPYSMYKNLANDALQLRRGGMYELYMVALSQLLADGKTMYGRIVSDPNGTPVVLSDYRALTGATNLRITPTPYWRDVLAVDTYVTGHLYHNDATATCGLIEFIVTERFK